MDFIERLAETWADEGVELRPGVSPDAICSFEREHGILLPEDVRRFYRTFNGTIGIDESLNAFWPLEEIDSVPTKLANFSGVPDYSKIETALADAQSFFVFADHSIWVHVFAMQMRFSNRNSTPVLWIANGITFATIAESFEHFWDLYLTDPNRLIGPVPLTP